jgi:hypothetical protein
MPVKLKYIRDSFQNFIQLLAILKSRTIVGKPIEYDETITVEKLVELVNCLIF